jgi:hypothetical protein
VVERHRSHPIDMLESHGDIRERRYIGRAQGDLRLRSVSPDPLLVERTVVAPDQHSEIQQGLETTMRQPARKQQERCEMELWRFCSRT